jgi:hypothetical protein
MQVVAEVVDILAQQAQVELVVVLQVKQVIT